MTGQYKVRSYKLASGYSRSGQVGTDWVKSCKFRSRSGQVSSGQIRTKSGQDSQLKS